MKTKLQNRLEGSRENRGIIGSWGRNPHEELWLNLGAWRQKKRTKVGSGLQKEGDRKLNQRIGKSQIVWLDLGRVPKISKEILKHFPIGTRIVTFWLCWGFADKQNKAAFELQIQIISRSIATKFSSHTEKFHKAEVTGIHQWNLSF